MARITQAEARVLAEAVRQRGAYLFRRKQRMEKSDRKADPLYAKVCAAHDALHGLWVHLHYRGCGVGPAAVGRV